MIRLSGIEGVVPGFAHDVEIERPESGYYDENGEWIKAPSELITIRASVQTTKDKDLVDVDEGRRVKGSIKLYSCEELKTASVDGRTQPDIVHWNGDRYQIEKVENWSFYGDYYKAIAVRMDQ